jgi:hypothetical protein
MKPSSDLDMESTSRDMRRSDIGEFNALANEDSLA